MKASSAAKLSFLLSLAALPAHAQTDRPNTDRPSADSVAASLSEMLSLATLGTVTTKDQAVQVTQSGDDYLVRLPLKGFAAPADAAVNAVARSLDGGMWDIQSLTFPSTGTVETKIPNAGKGQVEYSIGQQAIHLRIDPDFVHPSSFDARLATIKMHTDQAGQLSDQSFDSYVADGTLSSNAPGQLTVSSSGTATNWHVTAHLPNGMTSDGLVRTLSGRVAVEGLDRAQGVKLMTAARGLMANEHKAPPGQPPVVSPVQHQDLQAMVDALPGLLARFSAKEALDDIHFSAGTANSGTIGRMRVEMGGEASNDRLNTHMDIGMDELSMTGLPPGTIAYVPHHFALKSMLSGVQVQPLLALLRAAAAPDADPTALLAGFTKLFSDADARIGIETLTFDSGPMQVTGSARVVPRPNGQLGANIHVSASGMDALIAKAQGAPAMQQALPVLFMAKGMGRPDGGALVWDITFGDGPPTVNGVPFGQPAAPKR